MEKINKSKNYILAFIIPFIICLTFMYFKGILTEVEDIYVSDLRLQHIVFLNYFKNVLSGNASLFYSFSAGMGNSMLATIIFYCISPINFLLFIINDIRYAILFIYITKVSLAGLTMFILLKSKNNKATFMTVIFSTCYALCAFAINYFFCIFWFDCLYLAPLVTLGIDKIFNQNKYSLLYILSLSLTIICNIQMGFGLCIYSVIYFIYSFNIRYNIKKEFKKFLELGSIFTISSLCVGAISSVSLLSFLSSFSDFSSIRSAYNNISNSTANIGAILKNLFTIGNLKTDYYNLHEPFIYCGLIVTFFTILYMFNKNIDKKKRMHSFYVILTFTISFCIKFINLFWHLSAPMALNFRYSIYLGLFLTTISYECYTKITKLTKKDITILILSLLTGLFIIMAYNNETYIIYTFLFLILEFITILLVKNKNKKFQIILIILIFLELGMNGYLSIYTAKELPFGKINSYDSFEELATKNNFDDNYRIIYNYSYTDYTNDTLLLNKNSSLRYFSSIIYGNIINFYNRIGAAYGTTSYRMSAFDSPLITSLLGNKYFYIPDNFNNGIYEKINTYEITNYDYVKASNDTKEIFLYENPYALSLGYIIENDVKYEENMDIADYQNAIIKGFSGNDKDVIIKLKNNVIENDTENCPDNPILPGCISFSIDNNTNNKIIYTYSKNSFLKFSVLNNLSQTYLDVNKPLTIYTLDNNIRYIEWDTDSLDTEVLTTTTYNKNNLIESLELLRKNSLKNIKVTKNILTANINADKSGILFLSIPYDKNFKIYIDDIETNYYSLLDNTFIGLDILKGNHNIKLEYTNKSWTLYLLSSIIALIITIILTYFINKKRAIKELEKEKLAQILHEEKKEKSQTKKEKNNKKKRKK